MPRYPASPNWPAIKERVLAIIDRDKLFLTAIAKACGIRASGLHRNLYNGNQPAPKTEKRIEKWCEQHDPQTK